MTLRGASAAEVAVHDAYRAHYGMLAGWAARLVDDPDLGHDLATEAFVRLLHHRLGVRAPGLAVHHHRQPGP